MHRFIFKLSILAVSMGLTSLAAQQADTITIVSFAKSAFHGNGIDAVSGGVDLGQAGSFSVLALTGGIDESGPTGPDANPYTIAGNVGVASSGQKFSASGSVTYGGNVYIHSGSSYNSSAPGVPQPTMGSGVDSMLEQAKQDALDASSTATALGAAPTATYGTINNNFSISESSAGNFVFDITGVNFSGGKILTLSAPAGSTYLLNISSQLVLTFGSIVVSGGLSAGDVLINYTGTSDIRFSGGGNSSEIDGTILAPNAAVKLSPGVVVGSVIAKSISMSSGANVVPEPATTALVILASLIAGAGAAIRRRKSLLAR
jgi:choice-of-anchor A domain-containing protein